jgi:hypothetical protein
LPGGGDGGGRAGIDREVAQAPAQAVVGVGCFGEAGHLGLDGLVEPRPHLVPQRRHEADAGRREPAVAVADPFADPIGADAAVDAGGADAVVDAGGADAVVDAGGADAVPDPVDAEAIADTDVAEAADTGARARA